MDFNSVVINGIIFVLAIVCLAVEHFVPFRKDWRISKYQFVQIPYVLALIVLYFALSIIVPAYFPKIDTYFTHLPFIIGVIVATLLGEFFYYWYHRFAHNTEFLWRFHIFHHHLDVVNLTNLMLDNPIETSINYGIRFIPLLFLGFNFVALEAYAVVVTILSILTHVNFKVELGLFKYLIGNPELHRYHHSTVLKEAKNYSGLIPLWDIMFGTYYFKPGPGPEHVGITHKYKEHFPRKVLRQIVYPFTKNIPKF